MKRWPGKRAMTTKPSLGCSKGRIRPQASPKADMAFSARCQEPTLDRLRDSRRQGQAQIFPGLGDQSSLLQAQHRRNRRLRPGAIENRGSRAARQGPRNIPAQRHAKFHTSHRRESCDSSDRRQRSRPRLSTNGAPRQSDMGRNEEPQSGPHRSPPTGVPQAENFRVAELTLARLQRGALSCTQRFCLRRAGMRRWISDERNYSTPVEIGSAMSSSVVGGVVESRQSDFKVGEVVTDWFGWQQFAAIDPGTVIRRRCRQPEEAGDKLFAVARFPPSQRKSIRTSRAIERLHKDFRPGSSHKPCCPASRPSPSCSGRCSPRGRSLCGKSTDCGALPKSQTIGSLTSPRDRIA
jgi:hypothetical protein